MQQTTSETYASELGERGAKWLRSRYSLWVLAAISFAESLFAPILIDPFLVAMILAKPAQWVRYIVVSVVFSVLGGIVAYYLGALFFDTVGTYLLNLFQLQDTFTGLATETDDTGFAFVLIGALTPIPYKLVALASGLIQISFVTFLFASIFGRIIRLGLVGYAAYAVGPYALPIFRKHLLKLAYLFFIILIAYIVLRFLF